MVTTASSIPAIVNKSSYVPESGPNAGKKLDLTNKVRILPEQGSSLAILAGPDSPASWIAPALLLGSYEAASDLGYLEELGVTHIVNVTLECQPDFPSRFTHLHLPLRDYTAQRLAPYFDQVIGFIKSAIAGGGTVLLHCFHGISRSASFALAYIMSQERQNLEASFEGLSAARHFVEPNRSFMRELRALEKRLQLPATTVCLTPSDELTILSEQDVCLDPVRCLVSRAAVEGKIDLEGTELDAFAADLIAAVGAKRQELLVALVCSTIESYGTDTSHAERARAGLAAVLCALQARSALLYSAIHNALPAVETDEAWDDIDLPYKSRYLQELRAALGQQPLTGLAS